MGSQERRTAVLRLLSRMELLEAELRSYADAQRKEEIKSEMRVLRRDQTRLAVHARVRRRLRPRAPIEYGGDRQQPAPLRGVLRLLRQQANLRRRIVSSHRNSLAHGKRPRLPP